MLTIVKEERKYWIDVGNATGNRLVARVASANLAEINRKAIKFKHLTKSLPKV